jgi:hypothetical protein
LAGWIKLHRKLKNSLVFDNPDLLKVWIWCLLKATHDDYIQMIGLQEVELEKGQFIFGRKVAANELKMSESKTYRLIKKLETMQNLNIKANNKYSIITIANWELYQSDSNNSEQQFEQQMNNKRTTNEQQMNTNKNIKNNKNINNNIYSVLDNYTSNDDLRQALNDFLEMRKKIKKPMTERALNMLLSKLDELAATDEVKIKLLDQSILHNWQTVYPLKEEKQQEPKQSKPNKFHNFMQHEYAAGELEAIAQKRFEKRVIEIKSKQEVENE